MLGKTDFDLFERDVAEELFLAEQRMMSLGEAMTNVEHRLAFGGMSCWLQSTKTPLRDAEGRIVGLIVSPAISLSASGRRICGAAMPASSK
jgi:hypothetical protein